MIAVAICVPHTARVPRMMSPEAPLKTRHLFPSLTGQSTQQHQDHSSERHGTHPTGQTVRGDTTLPLQVHGKLSQVGTAEWRKMGPEARKHIRQRHPRFLRFGLGNNISPSSSPQVRTTVPTQPWPSRATGLPSPRAPNPTSTRDLLPSGRQENKDRAYINLYTWGAGAFNFNKT